MGDTRRAKSKGKTAKSTNTVSGPTSSASRTLPRAHQHRRRPAMEKLRDCSRVEKATDVLMSDHGLHRAYNSHDRTIRKRRRPLNLDQAAQRLHLSIRELQQWVREGRVPCHSELTRSPSGAGARQLSFDREEIDEALRRLRQPRRDRINEVVGALRGFQHRIGHRLHLDG